MNKELLAQILPIVEKTKAGILKGIEVAQQQVPDLIDQIYRWEFSVGCIGIVIGVLFIVIPIRWVKFLNKMTEEDSVPAFMGWVLPMGIGAVVFFINLMKCMKIIIASKLYLIEYISGIIN